MRRRSRRKRRRTGEDNVSYIQGLRRKRMTEEEEEY